MWYKIKGFPDYQINTFGEVRTRFNRKEWEILKPSTKDDGTDKEYYWMVSYNKIKCINCDEVVIRNFRCNLPEKYSIKHKDGNVKNHCPVNLTIIKR